MDAKPLDGAAALVTGACGGVGAATARRLADEGSAVALVARRRDRMDRIVGEIVAQGGKAVSVEADLTAPERAEIAVQDVLDRLQRLDILVNSAGVMLLGTALHTTAAEWDRMVRLNVSALVHVTHAAVPYLIHAAATSQRRVADIVNVSSIAGRVARPGSSVYTLTTSGTNGFSESLRQELLAERVRVGVIQPGAVGSQLVDDLDLHLRSAARRSVSGIEPLRAEDVADAIAYVVTRDSRIAVNEVTVRAGDQVW